MLNAWFSWLSMFKAGALLTFVIVMLMFLKGIRTPVCNDF